MTASVLVIGLDLIAIADAVPASENTVARFETSSQFTQEYDIKDATT